MEIVVALLRKAGRFVFDINAGVTPRISRVLSPFPRFFGKNTETAESDIPPPSAAAGSLTPLASFSPHFFSARDVYARHYYIYVDVRVS